MLENGAESHPSSARFVGLRFLTYQLFGVGNGVGVPITKVFPLLTST
jgi:hypothetical protein